MFGDRHYVLGSPSADMADWSDAFAGTVYSEVICLTDYAEAEFIVIKGSGATGTTKITLESCTTTSGTPTAIAFNYRKATSGDTHSAVTAATSAGFDTTAGADQIYQIYVNGSMLVAGDNYCRIKMVEQVDSPCDGAIIIFMDEARHSDVTGIA